MIRGFEHEIFSIPEKNGLAGIRLMEFGQDAEMTAFRVSSVYRIHGTASVAIPDDSPLEDIITRFAAEPGLRGVFLDDSQQQFTGVITRIDLLRWAHVQLFGGKGRDELRAFDIFRLVDATKARDLCRCAHQELSIKENDNLQTALDRMLDHEEDVLAVLNDQNEVVGDLRLSEVIWWAFINGRRQPENHE